MVDSSDFSQVAVEAEDIAQSVSQKLTSAHVLLALFTVENRAQLMLKERGVDEDRLLEALTSAPSEQDGLVRELYERSREIAQSCGSKETDSLHLLIATTRIRCAAQDLLNKIGLDLSSLRNSALSYYVGGRMPRKLQLGRNTPIAQPSPPKARLATSRMPATPAFESNTSRLSEPMPALPPPPQTRQAPLPIPAAEPNLSRPEVGKNGLDPKIFPLLTSIGRNLSALAADRKLDPVVGRFREVEEVIDVLGKRRTNNPCLVGEPGVGKTAVVEGVAQRLLQLSGPLSQRTVIELDMASLVAGTQLRGSFSEKLNALKDEVKNADGQVVVFIDELHTLVGAGSTGEGPQDAANELKAAMSRGEFPCIGATTHDEFRKYIAADPALERRFVPVVVNEPSVPETVEILRGIISRYEEHHGVRYDEKSLEAAASLAAKYVSDRFLPDKAISIADLAGSRCRREGKTTVEPKDVAKVVAKLAGLPEERLLLSDSARLLRMEEDLSARVIGHAEVVSKICQVVRRNYAGFSSRRPMGSFLFLGPTGVGKTEMAKALAEVLFGSPDAIIRLDMSEMSEPHSVSRLIGAPAGYVGHGEGGQLTEPVRRRPSSVLVLDEIEKAHRDVWMLLLQVLEEGRLTDGKGRHIDFSNAVVVMTTNLGAEEFGPAPRPLGFGRSEASQGDSADSASLGAQRALPPELWNRIDERLVFRPLGESQVAQVAELLLAESAKRLANEKRIQYQASKDVVEHLLKSGGYDRKLGARPMRQTIQRLVEAPLAERILSGEFVPGDRIQITLHQGRLAFERT